MVEISVVLPNYNGKHLLQRNLPSLFKALEGYDYQVIVADDASTDESVDFLFTEYPDIQVVECLENSGFSVTCNTGLRRAQGKYVCIANTDVEFCPDYFRNILPSLESGYFAAKGPIQNVTTDGALLNVDSIAQSFMKRGFWRFNKRVIYAETDIFSPDPGGKFPLLGCCFVANTENLKLLGGFDEIFSPYYWEDSDLPFRAMRAGEHLAYVPQARVLHQLSSTINTYRSQWKRKLVSDRNKFIFTWRHMQGYEAWLSHIGHQLFYFPFRWIRLDWSYYAALIGALFRHWGRKLHKSGALLKKTIQRAQGPIGPGYPPKASLIISVYKDPEKLACILRALAFQTEKAFEVIVSEDGQSQEIAKCVAKFRNCELTVKHLTQEDLGFRKNKALNQAIKAAESDYLIFIDGDCVPHLRFIESHLANAGQKIICAGRRLELGRGFSHRLITQPRFVGRLSNPVGLLGLLWSLTLDGGKNPESGVYAPWLSRFTRSRSFNLLGCNFSCFRSALEEVNGFNEDFCHPGIGEDTDLEWRFLRAGYEIRSVKFAAPLFHLWHERSYALSDENLRIHSESKKADYWRTKRGLLRLD